MRKLNLYLKSLIFTLGFLFFSTSVNITYANESKAKENDISRGKLVFSRYLSLEDIKFSPEEEFASSSGEKYYKKNVTTKKKFKKLEGSQDYKLKGNLDFDVTFIYDKKSFAKVRSPEDVKVSKGSKEWKIRINSEIRPSNKVCLVSNRYAIYKKDLIGVGDYIMDGHIDLLCSHMGEIGLNTELS